MFVAFCTALWDHVSHFVYRYESVPPLSFPLWLSLSLCLCSPFDLSLYRLRQLIWGPSTLSASNSIKRTINYDLSREFPKKRKIRSVPPPPYAISSLIATVAGLSFHVWHFLIIDSMFSLPFEDWNMCFRGHVSQRDCETEMKLIGKVRKKYLEISSTSFGTRNITRCSTRIELSYITKRAKEIYIFGIYFISPRGMFIFILITIKCFEIY